MHLRSISHERSSHDGPHFELEREVLHLRAVVKQMEEQHVPQIDDLRNRMDVVMHPRTRPLDENNFVLMTLACNKICKLIHYIIVHCFSCISLLAPLMSSHLVIIRPKIFVRILTTKI